MNPLHEVVDASGLTHVGTYCALFLAASLLMVWRLEALLDHGLEGTALGTLVMPYCSGLGNLIFVALVARGDGMGGEILTNCLVNNVTNLTLLLGLPALFWGLHLAPAGKASRGPAGRKRALAAGTQRQLTRLSLLLTLAAVLFFSAITWALASDGRLDERDGLVLIGLFLFWQCFQVFDVMKHNVRQQKGFGPLFYVDLSVVLAGAFGLYTSIDWLVEWITAQEGRFVNASHLGWLSGWLMVVPNALLAFYYAARRRGDVAFASQVGDSHICIPLCLGLGAVLHPIPIPAFFDQAILILLITSLVHATALVFSDGIPRWLGWPLVAAYLWFLAAGLLPA